MKKLVCVTFFVGDFLKKVPHAPQKLSDNLFLYRVYPSFSTVTSVPATGPQLPVAGFFVSVGCGANGLHFPCRDRRRFATPVPARLCMTVSLPPCRTSKERTPTHQPTARRCPLPLTDRMGEVKEGEGCEAICARAHRFKPFHRLVAFFGYLSVDTDRKVHPRHAKII